MSLRCEHVELHAMTAAVQHNEVAMSDKAMRPGKIDPMDFLDIDALLTDEERLIRDTVRSFVADQVAARRRRLVRSGHLPQGDGQGDGRHRAARHAPRRLRLRRDERRRVRAGLYRARVRRQRRPQLRVGPGFARHVPDLGVRL